ncbi:MAG: hypothetical protein R3B81_00785 [bacterium]|nr:hypothetical protein [Gemmatimonadota bacterium]
MRVATIATLSVLTLLGFGSARAAGGPFEPTLQDIQANVFTPGCALAACHGGAMQANLDLREGQAFSFLVDVPSVEVPTAVRVAPFDPDNSYIICKLENCPWIVGNQMPLIGGPLPQTTIDVIREWIQMGAPEFPAISVESESWGRVKSIYR